MSVRLEIERRMAWVVFGREDKPVNILDADTLMRLQSILMEIAGRKDLDAVVFESGIQGMFIAGADINEIATITTPKEAALKARLGQRVINMIEDLSLPTVAAVNGPALGGGLELALACRHILVEQNDRVQLGLPEVKLGIVPAFGGCHRLPKRVGLMRALAMIPAGEIVDAKKALRIGLADGVIPRANRRIWIAEWLACRPKRKTIKDPWWLQVPTAKSVLQHLALKTVRKKTKGFYPAPEEAVRLLMRIHDRSRVAALDAEAETFGRLAVTDVCKNLIRVFYLQERCKKIPPIYRELSQKAAFKKVGVIGAGVMGGGIAHWLAQCGLLVRLKDIKSEALGIAIQAARSLFDKAARRRKITPSAAHAALMRIAPTTTDTGFRHCDAVIEAVVEDLGVKQQVFSEIQHRVKKGTVMLTNTSALSIDKMADALEAPSSLGGFHFFNPVHRMPLVEIVKGPRTSDYTIAAAFALARRLGKLPILVQDRPGFLVNRILLMYINEAGHLLNEGADVVFLDRLAETFGLPMGPFALSDEVGLDVGLKVLHILRKELGERYETPALFETMKDKGWLGKKNQNRFLCS